MDSGALADAVDLLRNRDSTVHSLLVIRHGYVVADAYFHPFAPGWAHDVASVTKSVTSTLIGIAVGKGYIASLEQPLLGFFPQRTAANVDDRKGAITLKHLLTMTSGLECVTAPTEVTLYQMMASPDWVQFMLDLPMTHEPGTEFAYSSGGVHLLSAIIRQATGMSALEFAQQRLFGPLGILDVGWPYDAQGVNSHGWGDLRLRPHDMAKIGYLFLNEGMWEGGQVVSREWVAAATSTQVTFPGQDAPAGYGYLWWINPRGYYTAAGRGGQYIHVVPDKDMVVVLTGGSGGPSASDEVMSSFIIPAARSQEALPPNAEGAERLAALIRAIAEPRRQERQPIPPQPATASRVSRQWYALEPNLFGVAGCSLDFERTDEATLSLRLGPTAAQESALEVAVGVGLDNLYRVSPGRFGLPAAAKGWWEGENVFVIDLDEVANINRWRLSLAFDGERLSLTMEETQGLPPQFIRGSAQ